MLEQVSLGVEASPGLGVNEDIDSSQSQQFPEHVGLIETQIGRGDDGPGAGEIKQSLLQKSEGASGDERYGEGELLATAKLLTNRSEHRMLIDV